MTTFRFPSLPLLAALLLLLPLRMQAQQVDDAPKRYNVLYVKDHFFMQNDSDFNVIDTDIEWPELIYYKAPEMLKKFIAKTALGQDTTSLDMAYHRFKATYGTLVTGQLRSLPDDHRFCYVTVTARIKSYEPDKWISYEIETKVEPQKLSGVKAHRSLDFVTYDLQRDRLYSAVQLIRAHRITDGTAEPEFYNRLFPAIEMTDDEHIVSTVIDGVWFDAGRVGYHVSCLLNTRMVSYEVFMPYQSVRYMVSKEGRALMEKQAPEVQPRFLPLPQTWQGDSIYQRVEQMPRFRDGTEALKNYLAHVTPPAQNTKSGRVIVSFVVDKQGRAQDVRILGPLSPEADRHAAGVIMGMPPFTPGMHHGQPACVRMSLILTYQ